MIMFDENGFSHAYLARIATGEDMMQDITAISFGDDKNRIGFDALLVHFEPSHRPPWIGSFNKDRGGLNLLAPTSSEIHACIVASGSGWIVSVNNPHEYYPINLWPILTAKALIHNQLSLFADHQHLAAYRGPEQVWRTRVVTDELRIVGFEKEHVLCEGFEGGTGTVRTRITIESGEMC